MANARFRRILFRTLGLIFLFLLSGSVALMITGYSYVFKTLVYTYPGIDDLVVFHPIIDDPAPVRWPHASDYRDRRFSAPLSGELEKNKSVASPGSSQRQPVVRTILGPLRYGIAQQFFFRCKEHCRVARGDRG